MHTYVSICTYLYVRVCMHVHSVLHVCMCLKSRNPTGPGYILGFLGYKSSLWMINDKELSPPLWPFPFLRFLSCTEKSCGKRNERQIREKNFNPKTP